MGELNPPGVCTIKKPNCSRCFCQQCPYRIISLLSDTSALLDNESVLKVIIRTLPILPENKRQSLFLLSSSRDVHLEEEGTKLGYLIYGLICDYNLYASFNKYAFTAIKLLMYKT